MAFVNPQTQQATKSSPDEGPRLGKMFVALVFFPLNFFQTATQTARMMGFIQIHEMFYELSLGRFTSQKSNDIKKNGHILSRSPLFQTIILGFFGR